MRQYFDKDFFRFLFGFIAIISVSLMIIFATRMYEEGTLNKETANLLHSISP